MIQQWVGAVDAQYNERNIIVLVSSSSRRRTTEAAICNAVSGIHRGSPGGADHPAMVRIPAVTGSP